MKKKIILAFVFSILCAWGARATSTQFNIVTQVKGILAVANGGTGINVSGTSTLTAATVTTNTCQTVITTAATGALTTDKIEWAYASAPTSPNALMNISRYVTAGNVNFIRCNPTSASQVGTAMVINWRVVH
jgi:hypothetical protein